jgi:hypothetical protein
VRIWHRQPSKKLVVDGVARGEKPLETFPKTATYCHLLPFWSRKTAKSVATVSILILPFEGVPASLGPGLRTVSGAARSLGAKLSPSATYPMTGESANSQKKLLAAAIAKRTSVAKWATTNEVPERTAYRSGVQFIRRLTKRNSGGVADRLALLFRLSSG